MNIGDTISGYTILNEVGKGGFGVVYMVEKDGQRYAMKAVSPNADQETKYTAEYTAEPTLLCNLKQIPQSVENDK